MLDVLSSCSVLIDEDPAFAIDNSTDTSFEAAVPACARSDAENNVLKI